MLTISQLYIYPIKSLAGIKLDTVEVTDRGFKHDRRWMLVDENNRFLSQREIAVMALIKSRITDHYLEVTYKDSSIKIPLTPVKQEFITVLVWDDTCNAQLVDDDIDKWFSGVLGLNCRLVYMPDESLRNTDPQYTPEGYITSFADAYPFLMIGQASLNDLNSRLTQPIPMNRFRPNIVFKCAEPYQEDLINEFTINNIRFNGVKLCARCNIPTIDQDTAIAAKEPSKTMAGYRLKNKKIYFGQNLIHTGSGVISVGDELKVLSTHNEERFIV
ncbi:MOSC domain-containing protein [Mucilaginibacter auburnensis]|uniref:MOSC domain-containing protein n=1 Tax=Mucilaginibacter auburnensis TaxID=1457233 RepID=A0A2H9VLA7_9SPHI|nr:MOSC N-terminal beta barrel domain-containing protein [Mucilaginibacter auburnensis]PJJ79114.1 hypothetical protein CLV57_2239 [Mucilaginibacter auburnensis]